MDKKRKYIQKKPINSKGIVFLNRNHLSNYLGWIKDKDSYIVKIFKIIE